MKRIPCVLLLLGATAWGSNYYKLEMVKRIDQNLYEGRSGMAKVLIETQFCFELTIGTDATLKYDPYSYNNKIIFGDGTACDVKQVVVQ